MVDVIFFLKLKVVVVLGDEGSVLGEGKNVYYIFKCIFK